MGCSLQGSSVHGDSPGRKTGVGCHSLLQEIFPTQGSNPGLPHCSRILDQIRSHQESPRILVWVALLQGIFPIQESNRGLLHCRWILYQLSYQGSPQLDLLIRFWSVQQVCFWGISWSVAAAIRWLEHVSSILQQASLDLCMVAWKGSKWEWKSANHLEA